MSRLNKSLFSKIGYICLYVSDFDASILFYRNGLGLEPDTKVSTGNFFAFKTGSTQLALERGGFKKTVEKTREENPILLQFRADSPGQFEEMNTQLEAHGVNILKRSKNNIWGISTSFLDPDGNKLEIVYMY